MPSLQSMFSIKIENTNSLQNFSTRDLYSTSFSQKSVSVSSVVPISFVALSSADLVDLLFNEVVLDSFVGTIVGGPLVTSLLNDLVGEFSVFE